METQQIELELSNRIYKCTLQDNVYIFESAKEFNGYIHEVIQLLQEEFPKLFPEKPLPKLPLKIGIHKDLRVFRGSFGIPEKLLRVALKYWCKGKRYQVALKAGQELNMRFGLYGETFGYKGGNKT